MSLSATANPVAILPTSGAAGGRGFVRCHTPPRASLALSVHAGILGESFYARGVLEINEDRVRELATTVDGILTARRGLLPTVQREVDDAAQRRNDVERLVSLLRELRDTEKDQVALLLRPGFRGGSQLMEDESHVSTQEVPRRAA